MDSNDVSNSISMMRSRFNGMVLVVEGITDYRLYGKFINREECLIIVAHSKDNVLSSVRESYRDRKDGKVMGIVDTDLDNLMGIEREPPIFETDSRDLEMVLIKSESFREVLQEYSEMGKLEAFERKNGPVKEALVKASYPLGLLMYVSEVIGMGLCFRDLDFEAFISPYDLSCDLDTMIDEVLYSSGKPPSYAKKVLRALDKEMCKERDPWLVCRGHDTVEILLIGLKKNFGSFNCRNLSGGSMAGALRLAYDLHDFQNLALYRDTKEWSKSKGCAVWEG